LALVSSSSSLQRHAIASDCTQLSRAMSDPSDNELGNEEEDETKANNLADPEIVTKYRLAGDIATKTLAKLCEMIVPGKSPLEISEAGDAMINEACAAVYSKSKLEKGVAFPTCVSVNNCVGHFCPLKDEDGPPLAPGDIVKLDLGVHIDAYATQVAFTLVVPNADGSAPTMANLKAMDVIKAAHDASELMQRMFKVGAKGSEMSAMVEAVATSYGVSAVQGVLSHQSKKHVIDGNRCVNNKPTVEHKVDEVTFEANDVFSFDVVLSTGEGKSNEQSARTTIFKRAVDQTYKLKMKTSRAFFSEVNKRFSTFPFTLRALADSRAAKMGVVECVNHELMESYPVLYEKPGEVVAHFKFTAMLLPTSIVRATEGPALQAFVTSEKKVRMISAKSLAALMTN